MYVRCMVRRQHVAYLNAMLSGSKMGCHCHGGPRVFDFNFAFTVTMNVACGGCRALAWFVMPRMSL